MCGAVVSKKQADQIASLVERFFRDRRGFRQTWEEMDPDVEEELRTSLRQEILSCLNEKDNKDS